MAVPVPVAYDKDLRILEYPAFLTKGDTLTFEELDSTLIALWQAANKIPIEINVLDLYALQQNNLLAPGSIYVITDDAIAVKIYLFALDSGTLSPDGYGLYINADYNLTSSYDTFAFSGVVATQRQGVYHVGLESFMVDGNIVIRNNKHYQVVNAAAFNGEFPEINEAAYLYLPKDVEGMGYVAVIDRVLYDVASGKAYERLSARNERITSTPQFALINDIISNYQWGWNLNRNNHVFNSVLNNMNCRNPASDATITNCNLIVNKTANITGAELDGITDTFDSLDYSQRKSKGYFSDLFDSLSLSLPASEYIVCDNGAGGSLYTLRRDFTINGITSKIECGGKPVKPSIILEEGTTEFFISQTGLVTYYSSGVLVEAGTLDVATFNDPSQLADEGDGFWSATGGSGAPTVSQPSNLISLFDYAAKTLYLPQAKRHVAAWTLTADEWVEETIYAWNQLVFNPDNKKLYRSKVNSNQGNLISDTNFWEIAVEGSAIIQEVRNYNDKFKTRLNPDKETGLKLNWIDYITGGGTANLMLPSDTTETTHQREDFIVFAPVSGDRLKQVQAEKFNY